MKNTYKAVEVSAPGMFRVVERTVSEPGAGQVRIRVEACGTTTLPKHSGRPAIQAARKATSTMTIPNSVEVNEVPDANRIQSNCSQ
jgi:hypothetical protein